MKTYKINVNGQVYTVEIDDPNASPATVHVNGKPFEVTISEQGAVEARAAAQATASAAPEIGMVEAYVPAVTSTFVEVGDEPAREPQAGAAAVPSEGGRPVTAPMPGTILDIAVQAGDTVQEGDTLCNLEAMKMKSPIRAPGAGTIVQVLISEGQNVQYGDVLFTVG